jgi:hypothetical protein
MSRTTSSEFFHYVNKTQNSIGFASVDPPNFNIILQAQNRDGTITNFQNRNVSFFTLGAGLTGTEWNTLVDINQTYQTNLGRFV